MTKEQNLNILLTLLILLSILSFTRTFVYILFDNHLVDIDKKLGFNFEIILEGILTIFAVIRLYIISIISIKMPFQSYLLSAVLIYLAFTSLLRFYYEYLYFFKPDSPEKQFIDKYQDVNAVLIFISSAIILKQIFF